MRGFGEEALVAYEVIDGLTHVTPSFLATIGDVLKVATFQPPDPTPITFEMGPTVGVGGGDQVVSKLAADGYVVLVKKPLAVLTVSETQLLVTKSPLAVATAARPGGTHAVMTGSALVQKMAEGALVVQAAPSKSWFVPAAATVGVIGLLLLLRR